MNIWFIILLLLVIYSSCKLIRENQLLAQPTYPIIIVTILYVLLIVLAVKGG